MWRNVVLKRNVLFSSRQNIFHYFERFRTLKLIFEQVKKHSFSEEFKEFRSGQNFFRTILRKCLNLSLYRAYESGSVDSGDKLVDWFNVQLEETFLHIVQLSQLGRLVCHRQLWEEEKKFQGSFKQYFSPVTGNFSNTGTRQHFVSYIIVKFRFQLRVCIRKIRKSWLGERTTVQTNFIKALKVTLSLIRSNLSDYGRENLERCRTDLDCMACRMEWLTASRMEIESPGFVWEMKRGGFPFVSSFDGEPQEYFSSTLLTWDVIYIRSLFYLWKGHHYFFVI